jgi:hypothetical protein
MKNPIPSPIARPAEYAAGLVGVILLVLTDAGVAISAALLISLPILANWIVTGIAAYLESRTAPQEVDANPDDEA